MVLTNSPSSIFPVSLTGTISSSTSVSCFELIVTPRLFTNLPRLVRPDYNFARVPAFPITDGRYNSGPHKVRLTNTWAVSLTEVCRSIRWKKDTQREKKRNRRNPWSHRRNPRTPILPTEHEYRRESDAFGCMVAHSQTDLLPAAGRARSSAAGQNTMVYGPG
jgi:hypothetical protein